MVTKSGDVRRGRGVRGGPLVVLAFGCLAVWLAAQGAGRKAGPAEEQDAGPGWPRTVEVEPGQRVRVERRPERVLAYSVGAAEILLSLVDASRIVGVHALCLEPRYSNVSARLLGGAVAVVSSTESMLLQKPDLLVTAGYTRPEVLAQVERLSGTAVVVLRQYDRLADLRASMGALGLLVGEEARAAELVREFDDRLARAAALGREGAMGGGGRPRVLSLFAGEFIAGSGTLFDDVLGHIGAVNVAGAQGVRGHGQLSAEQWAVWGVDVVVIPAGERRLLEDRLAVRRSAGHADPRVVEVDSGLLLAVSQYTAVFAERLAEQLYAVEAGG